MNRREFTRMMALAGAATTVPRTFAWAAAESPTLQEIKDRGALRIGVFSGTEPYYHKDLATGKWSGFCVSMAEDLAAQIGVKLQTVDTTWGNAVLDLQARKIDVMFGLSANPERAKVVDFSETLMDNTFTALSRADFPVTNWADLNKPEVRVAVDLGSTQDVFARRELPNCTLVALKGAEDTNLALRSGRADAIIQVALLAVVTAKNLGPDYKLTVPEPRASQPTTIGMRKEPDAAFRAYINDWLAQRRADGKVSEWVVQSLELVGVTPDMLPANLTF